MNQRRSFRIKSSEAGAVAVIAALLAAAPASATTIDDCRDQISALQASTIATEFKTKKDEDGLIAKLMDAKLKLGVAKFSDASQKISDYQAKLNQLGPQGKILEPANAYSTLMDGAIAVQGCIGNIGK